MVKSCCAVRCTNRHYKGCGLSFYRFPTDSYRRNKWIATIKKERTGSPRNILVYVVRTLLVGKRVTIDSLQTLFQVFSAMYIVLRNEEGSGSWKDMSKECMLRKSA